MRPKRSLGQNFLIDPNYQRKITQAVQSQYKGETLVEIGPGRGALTKHLVTFAPKLVLIEKDNELACFLKNEFSDQKSLTVICKDFLKLDFSVFSDPPYHVVANLPYNVSTQILIRHLEHRELFKSLILMFQKEVATRCVAKPGTKDFGILSVWCQENAFVRKLFDVPPTAFRPRPKITSTVLQFDLKPGAQTEQDKEFTQFVKLIFSQRRKKISSLLKKKYDLGKMNSASELPLLVDKRAEQLTIEEMKLIFKSLKFY